MEPFQASLFAPLSVIDRRLKKMLNLAAVILVSILFVADTFIVPSAGIASLYGVATIISLVRGQKAWIFGTAGLSLALTLIGYGIGHGRDLTLPSIFRCVCTLMVQLAFLLIALYATRMAAQFAGKLKQVENRHRNIFQTTGIGIWEVDFSSVKRRLDVLIQEGVTDLRAYIEANPGFVRQAIDAAICHDVNEAAVRLFGGGRPKADLLGPIGRFWPPESEPTFAESVLAARGNRPSFEMEVYLLTLDNRRMKFFISAAFPPEAASRENVFVTFVDITARSEAQEALRIAQATLANATRLTSIGELAASIVHEVNHPIAAVLANGQAALNWLKRPIPNLKEIEGSLNEIVSDAKRAGNVFKGIRALAINETPNVEILDLNILIKETCLLLAPEMLRNQITIVKDLNSNLPIIQADPIQIQQVLINLMLNAAHAVCTLGNPKRLITITTRDGVDFVSAAIADTGPGVSPAVKEQLFTPFNTTRADGMGLGLSVCASIIKRHEGRIWLDKSGEDGATFMFHLPKPLDGQTTIANSDVGAEAGEFCPVAPTSETELSNP